MEKEKLTPLVLTLGLIIYGCTASAGQNDKIDGESVEGLKQENTK